MVKTEENNYKNFIDGKWVEPTSGDYYSVYNPADSDEKIGSFPLSSKEDVEKAVESAEAAFQKWRKVPASKRAEYVYRLVEILDDKKEEIGKLLCKEEGKPLSEAIGEVSRGPVEMKYIAGEAVRLEGSTFPSERPGIKNKVIRTPIGVIAAINPWNYPFLTPIRKIIPALVSGCTVVFKPANPTPLSGVLLTELIEKAGFPPGTVNLVIGRGSEIGNTLVGHPLVKGVSFTGSTEVGQMINSIAAETFTKTQLEMGGCSPLVVADYSNLKEAASQAVKGTYTNSGQRCTAIRRVIVLEKHAEELENHIINEVEKFNVGNGMDDSTDIGPLINQDAVESMLMYIESARKDGANIATGGKKIEGGSYSKGNYFEPTVITDVTPDMKVAREEMFGPILVILRVKSFEEALRVSNNTRYGLSASLFTDKLEYIHDFMEDVEAGQIHINHQTSTDSYLPFGGVKDSGHGPFSKGKTNKDFYTKRTVIYTRYK